MKYFIDTEFLEGTQKTWWGSNTKPTIDLISIGIVSEDGREYYAINKEFNLKEAWNRFDWKEHKSTHKVDEGKNLQQKVYWIKDNVLKPIWEELCAKTVQNYFEIGFTYENLKKFINKYGKTNKQIAKEIVQFMDAHWIEEGNISKGFIYPGETSIKEVKTTNVEFYGYYSDYDWVVFCWLFGKMKDLPKNFPMYCIDLKQTLDTYINNMTNNEYAVWEENIYGIDNYIPIKPCTKEDKLNIVKKHLNYPKEINEHNALADARWNKELYEFLEKIK